MINLKLLLSLITLGTITGQQFEHHLLPMPDGIVYGIGSNSFGQLGLGTPDPFYSTPTPIPTLTGTVSKVAMGAYHSLALHNDGTLSAWGKNTDGQLGTGDQTDQNIPVSISGTYDKIAAGEDASFAISSGKIYGWGNDMAGHIGLGCGQIYTTPTQISNLSFSAISFRTTHGLALTTGGDLYGWGDNTFNQLDNTLGLQVCTPQLINGVMGTVSISAGNGFSLVLAADGRVYGWGNNYYGQTGVDIIIPQVNTPTELPGLIASHIYAGIDYSLIVLTNGTVVAFGRNDFHQTGAVTNTLNTSVSPTALVIPSIVFEAVAKNHNSFAYSARCIYVWGDNNYGVLGLNDFMVTEPTILSSLQTQPCDICSPGTYIDGFLCAQCQPGSMCLNEVSTFCTAGTYQPNSSATSCADCPAGTFSSSGAISCEPCPLGTYSDTTATAICTPCPGGMFQNTTGSTSCYTCSAGTASSDSSSSCTECSPGMYQPNTNSSSCLYCDAGTYQAAVGATTCDSCGVGNYSSSGSAVCTQCDAGTYQPNTNSSSCLPCPSGSAQNGTSSTSCNVCPAGTAPDLNKINCEPCTPGSYQPVENSSSCLLCPAGTSQSLPGMLSCDTCLAGTFSMEGAPNCDPCQSGYYQPNVNSSSCLPCPTGSSQFLTGQTGCDVCSPGTYTDVEGSPTCQSCTMGTYQPNVNSTSCLLCPAGSSSNDMLTCNLCTSGSFTSIDNSVVCDLCPPGQFSNTSGATSCSLCPGGFSSAQGSSSCTQCDPGYYAVAGDLCALCTGVIAPDQSSCTLCQLGETVVNNTCVCLLTGNVSLPCQCDPQTTVQNGYSCCPKLLANQTFSDNSTCNTTCMTKYSWNGFKCCPFIGDKLALKTTSQACLYKSQDAVTFNINGLFLQFVTSADLSALLLAFGAMLKIQIPPFSTLYSLMYEAVQNALLMPANFLVTNQTFLNLANSIKTLFPILTIYPIEIQTFVTTLLYNLEMLATNQQSTTVLSLAQVYNIQLEAELALNGSFVDVCSVFYPNGSIEVYLDKTCNPGEELNQETCMCQPVCTNTCLNRYVTPACECGACDTVCPVNRVHNNATCQCEAVCKPCIGNHTLTLNTCRCSCPLNYVTNGNLCCPALNDLMYYADTQSCTPSCRAKPDAMTKVNPDCTIQCKRPLRPMGYKCQCKSDLMLYYPELGDCFSPPNVTSDCPRKLRCLPSYSPTGWYMHRNELKPRFYKCTADSFFKDCESNMKCLIRHTFMKLDNDCIPSCKCPCGKELRKGTHDYKCVKSKIFEIEKCH